MKKTAVLAVLAFTTLVHSASAQTVVEEIVARVNDKIITKSDLERSRQQALAELKQENVPDAEQKAAKLDKDALRDLIDQQLLLERGQDDGITGEAETIKQLDEIRKKNHLDSMEALEKEAASQGVSYEDFKQSITNGIITQQVISQDVGRRIQITPTEAQAYYDKHKSELDRPESVHLAEILISTTPADVNATESTPAADPDPAQLAVAEKKANDILAQLKNGADFAALAKKYSSGPTAAQGGDLGSFKRGILAKELEDQTFNVPVGQTTGVIQTKQGLDIIKVLEHDKGGIPPFKDVQRQVEEAVYYEKLQPALRAFLTDLRRDAFIDIKPGYVDTGASPDETKPIYTSVATKEGKKAKKRHKKFGII